MDIIGDQPTKKSCLSQVDNPTIFIRRKEIAMTDRDHVIDFLKAMLLF